MQQPSISLQVRLHVELLKKRKFLRNKTGDMENSLTAINIRVCEEPVCNIIWMSDHVKVAKLGSPREAEK